MPSFAHCWKDQILSRFVWKRPWVYQNRGARPSEHYGYEIRLSHAIALRITRRHEYSALRIRESACQWTDQSCTEKSSPKLPSESNTQQSSRACNANCTVTASWSVNSHADADVLHPRDSRNEIVYHLLTSSTEKSWCHAHSAVSEEKHTISAEHLRARATTAVIVYSHRVWMYTVTK